MFVRLSLLYALILSVILPVTAHASTSQEELKYARLIMFRASADLISHRGDRIDAALQETIKNHHIRLKGLLSTALSSDDSEKLSTALDSYLTIAEDALAYDPREIDYYWEFNLNFSNAMYELDKQIILQEAKATPSNPDTEDLLEHAVRLEFLATRYASRAYMSPLHTRSKEGYFGMDLQILAENTEEIFNSSAFNENNKAYRFWQFIKSRYLDYELQLAPMIVVRNSRKITDWIFADEGISAEAG
ncbi:hypothetical protein [Parendozoicomonas haliclonae]|uniref:Uncharacterized protein n=1 Tax=Parendozoicomonas haliclonae TaxID=1960125 RepID=A0A1X7ADL7_9GAMM|nr:hypothetical protein [Parendozoicomonas haliclonae]SMA32113.1 hypothetical protein EHSB41UT_00106 [Parendozoicomonas haliclonae]